MSIQNLSPDVAMHHMLTTLRPGLFANNLCMQPATSLDKLRKKAAKFMQLEELREFRNQARAETNKEKSKEEKDLQGWSGQWGDRRINNRDRGIWFSRYPANSRQGKNPGRGTQRRVNPSSQEDGQPKQRQPKEAVAVSSKQRTVH